MLHFTEAIAPSHRRRWRYGLLSILAASALILTAPRPSQAFSLQELLLRGVQVLQLSSLSNSQEVKLGQQINQQLIQTGRFKVVRERQLNQYLNTIGQRLARTSSRPNIPYTFQVIDDNKVNAFATMGGFVYINTGLIKFAENEAELASVVAHEISHVAARHAVEQMRNSALTQGLISASGLKESTAVQLGVNLAVNLPHSRQDELEADQLGLANLRRAGYAPIGMLTFMQKLGRQGRSAPAFLSTHPGNAERVRALQSAINLSTASHGDGLDPQAYQRQIRSARR